jgi:hypothetical protein
VPTTIATISAASANGARRISGWMLVMSFPSRSDGETVPTRYFKSTTKCADPVLF